MKNNLSNDDLYVTMTMERYNELISLEKGGVSELHPDGIKISHLDLPARVHSIFRDNKISTVNQLVSCIEDRSFLRYNRVGKRAVNEVVECLKKNNLISKDFPLMKTADKW